MEEDDYRSEHVSQHKHIDTTAWFPLKTQELKTDFGLLITAFALLNYYRDVQWVNFTDRMPQYECDTIVSSVTCCSLQFAVCEDGWMDCLDFSSGCTLFDHSAEEPRSHHLSVRSSF